MIERVTEIRETLKYQLAWAQAVQKEYADRKRVPAPEIKVGDWVMLDAKNVSTNRPSDKLDYKNLGRFKVSEVAKNESAVKLDLPESFKIFPWFHPVLIHLASPPTPSQEDEQPGPLEVYEGEAAYEVEEILNSRIHRGKNDPILQKRGCLQYQIKYKGYSEDKPPWQDWIDVLGCPNLVHDFHQRNPEKEGPHQTFKNYTPENWDNWEADVEAQITASLAFLVLKKEEK